MQRYELSYLIPAETAEEEKKNLSEKIVAYIQENGGILEDLRQPVEQKLAYPVKGKTSAFLVSMNFLIIPEKIAGIEGKLKSEPAVIRYLLTVKKTVKPGKRAPRRIPPKTSIFKPEETATAKEGKVELQEIDKKLEEILSE